MTDTAAIITAAVLAVVVVALASGLLAYTAPRRVPVDALHHYEVALAEMQARLERTEQHSDRQQERIDQMQAAIEAEQEYSRTLARAMREAGMEVPPRPVAPVVPVVPVSDTAALTKRVAACYSVEEIDTLAMELGLDGALTGETLENRAASLVKAALRRGVLSELVTIARRDRPRGGF